MGCWVLFRRRSYGIVSQAGVDRAFYTYYVVAHFHYVMSLELYSHIAGIYYWIGKMSGRQYPEWAESYIFVYRLNITSFPQHFLGRQGMPRRYIDYPEQLHYGTACLNGYLSLDRSSSSLVFFIH